MESTTPLDFVTTATAIDALAKNNPSLYQDLAQPTVQNLGKALSTVTNLVNTVLTPLEILNEKTVLKKEQFLKDYAKELQKIPEDKVCEPNICLIGPMIEKLKYKVSEDTLREKYSKLIAATSNSDHLTKPLLSFDSVLNQMTPYEVELLFHLFPQLIRGKANNIAIADIQYITDDGFYTFPFRNITGVNFKNLDFNIIAVMISNLERLGLIYIDKLNFVEPVKENYHYILESQLLKTLNENAEKLRTNKSSPYPRYDIVKGHFSLTDFGISFVQTVLL